MVCWGGMRRTGRGPGTAGVDRCVIGVPNGDAAARVLRLAEAIVKEIHEGIGGLFFVGAVKEQRKGGPVLGG